jgi:hypothetical protein
MDNAAYQTGYQNGATDVRLGRINRCAWHADMDASAYARAYGQGYRKAVYQAQLASFERTRALQRCA